MATDDDWAPLPADTIEMARRPAPGVSQGMQAAVTSQPAVSPGSSVAPEAPPAAGGGSSRRPVGAGQPDGDRDPREDQPWFRALPAAERQRLSRRWGAARGRHDQESARRLRGFARVCGQSVLFLGACGLLFSPVVGSGAVWQMMLIGGLGSLLGQVFGGDRFAMGGAGAVVFLAIMGPGALLIEPLKMVLAIVATFGLAAIGMQGEMERTGGFTGRAGGRRPPTLD